MSEDGPRFTAANKAVPIPPCAVDGNGSFSNLVLALLVGIMPALVMLLAPSSHVPNAILSYLLLLPPVGAASAIAYWSVMSRIGGWYRPEDNKRLLDRGIDHYIEFSDLALKRAWSGKNKKMPMQLLHDAYFDAKLDFKGLRASTLARVWTRKC